MRKIKKKTIHSFGLYFFPLNAFVVTAAGVATQRASSTIARVIAPINWIAFDATHVELNRRRAFADCRTTTRITGDLYAYLNKNLFIRKHSKHGSELTRFV